MGIRKLSRGRRDYVGKPQTLGAQTQCRGSKVQVSREHVLSENQSARAAGELCGFEGRCRRGTFRKPALRGRSMDRRPKDRSADRTHHPSIGSRRHYGTRGRRGWWASHEGAGNRRVLAGRNRSTTPQLQRAGDDAYIELSRIEQKTRRGRVRGLVFRSGHDRADGGRFGSRSRTSNRFSSARQFEILLWMGASLAQPVLTSLTIICAR